MKVNVIVEGGETTDDTRLRTAFSEFFRKALKERLKTDRFSSPRIIAGAGRKEAIEAFAQRPKQSGEVTLLLIDSEGPLPNNVGIVDFINNKNGQHNPHFSEHNLPATADKNIFLMVELMESWLLADTVALENYYGSGFRPNSIVVSSAKGNLPEIEHISKPRVYEMLKAATKQTNKGEYEHHKADHSFDLIGKADQNKPAREHGGSEYSKRKSVDPVLVGQAAQHCMALIDRLAELCGRL